MSVGPQSPESGWQARHPLGLRGLPVTKQQLEHFCSLSQGPTHHAAQSMQTKLWPCLSCVCWADGRWPVRNVYNKEDLSSRHPAPGPPASSCTLSRVQLCATPWTVGCHAPLFAGFPRQEHWSGLPCPSPGDLPDPGIEPMSLLSPALAGRFFTASTTWEAVLLLQRVSDLSVPASPPPPPPSDTSSPAAIAQAGC